MSTAFPIMRTASMNEVPPGSIISFPRSDGLIHALATDRTSNGSRALVLLNRPTEGGRRVVTYIENWRDPERVLVYADEPRFEINEGHADPGDRHSWEIPGVLVAIGDRTFIRAVQPDRHFEGFKLVDIQSGSVLAGEQPINSWAFLAWELWIRDPLGHRHRKLFDFGPTVGKPST
ncbi:hypothetical protein [Bradyrhizobium liaoningense]